MMTMEPELIADYAWSVTFGGDDYMDMYVTTAGGDNKATVGQGAGALFRLRLGIKGVPEFRSRISLMVFDDQNR